jgi:hypothetical protein
MLNAAQAPCVPGGALKTNLWHEMTSSRLRTLLMLHLPAAHAVLHARTA